MSKSKNPADEYTAFMPAYVAAVVHSPEHADKRTRSDSIRHGQSWSFNANCSCRLAAQFRGQEDVKRLTETMTITHENY
jgi:hypothetical protein